MCSCFVGDWGVMVDLPRQSVMTNVGVGFKAWTLGTLNRDLIGTTNHKTYSCYLCLVDYNDFSKAKAGG